MASAAESFVVNKNVRGLLEGMMAEMVEKKPENVPEFISQYMAGVGQWPKAEGKQEEGGSVFGHVPELPPDAIFGLNTAFANDPHPEKVILGAGTYRDGNGKAWVLPSVREAERRLYEAHKDMEYTAIDGVPDFVPHARALCFGNNCSPLKEERIASGQSLSGTGALRVLAEFLRDWYIKDHEAKTVYIPDPTWPNHVKIFAMAGLTTASYPYYSRALNGLDFDRMLATIEGAPERSIILLHACAHNPTGADPTPEQWDKIKDVCKARNHFVMFDSAYQGFASGDPDKDAAPIRSFAEAGLHMGVCQSFSKNMGLYGQRCGAVHVVCPSKKEAKAVLSQLKLSFRAMFSNPPIHGARLAALVLNQPDIQAMWKEDIKTMSSRIEDMRTQLVAKLAAAGSKHDWSHITRQIGMFAYTGLTKPQVERMRDEFHIYLTLDGRISLAGLNPANLDLVARAIHAVTAADSRL